MTTACVTVEILSIIQMAVLKSGFSVTIKILINGITIVIERKRRNEEDY